MNERLCIALNMLSDKRATELSRPGTERENATLRSERSGVCAVVCRPITSTTNVCHLSIRCSNTRTRKAYQFLWVFMSLWVVHFEAFYALKSMSNIKHKDGTNRHDNMLSTHTILLCACCVAHVRAMSRYVSIWRVWYREALWTVSAMNLMVAALARLQTDKNMAAHQLIRSMPQQADDTQNVQFAARCCCCSAA